MKKLLLATALVAGFATAHAQSNVTIFGVLDTGYSGVTTRSTTPTKTTKSTLDSFGQGYSTPSRLGFKGTEDLGGGASALFMIDMALYPTEATLSGNGKNGILNRQSYVGLKQNGIGQATIGTQFTPIFTQGAKTDPGAFNDVVGSAIYPASYNAGVTTAGFTVRTSNTLALQSDSFKGFRAGASYANNSKDTTQTGPNNLAGTNGGNTDISGVALNADYTYDKLYATVVYQTFKNQNPTTVVSPAATPMTNDYGSNVSDAQKYAAVTYDFGILKAYAQYIDRKATSTLNSGNFLSRQAQQIGVRGNITPRVTAFASVGNGRYSAFGSRQPTANFVSWQAGSEYALSKRTALYGIVGSTQTSSTSTGSAGANQYAVGMRHTF